MSNDEISYKGKKIKATMNEGKPDLFVNGKRLPVSFDEEAASYNTSILPYQTFSTLQDLAKAVIDDQGS